MRWWPAVNLVAIGEGLAGESSPGCLGYTVLVTGAEVQDRTAAHHLLARLKYFCPCMRDLWADSVPPAPGVTIDIVAKLAVQIGSVVPHRRSGVERVAWFDQHCR